MLHGAWIAGYWLLLSVLGMSLVRLPALRASVPEAAIPWLVPSLGAGTASLLLFWLSLAGVRPSRPLLLALLVLGAVALVVIERRGARRRLEISPLSGMTRIDWLLCVALAIPLVAIAAEELTRPLSNIDAIAIWGLKAKVVYHEPVRASEYFRNVAESFSHLDYPLLLPFLSAGQFALAGGGDEGLARSVHLGLFVTFGLLVIQVLGTILSCRQALLLAIVFLSCPALFARASAGLADLALMLYYLGSVTFLLSWATTRSRGHLLLGAFLSALLLFTKNEGSALALINVVVCALWAMRRWGRRGLVDAAAYAGLVVALSAPWLVFASGIPRTHENYLGRLRFATILDHLDRLPVIGEAFLRAMLDVGAWNGLWILLLVSVLAGHRGVDTRRASLLWLLLALHLGTYGVIFVVTPWDVGELLDIKAYPLLLQVSPVAVLLVAEHWRGFSRRGEPALAGGVAELPAGG